MGKVFSHEPDPQDFARLAPSAYEEDCQTRTVDWQPWAVIAAVVVILAVSSFIAGRASAQTIKEWFNSLSSVGGGVCCYDYDGIKLSERDWEGGKTYRIIIDEEWVDVPPDRVVQEPNRLGVAFEWHYYSDGKPVVRCFIPGTLS